MPSYSEVFTRLLCPKCGCEIVQAERKVKFQWGAVPSSYEIGEKICWRAGLHGKQPWCIGDPAITDIVIVDSDVNLTTWQCTNCNTILDKPCVEIRNGRIKSVWLFEKGGFESKTGCNQGMSNYFRFSDPSKVFPLPDFDLS